MVMRLAAYKSDKHISCSKAYRPRQLLLHRFKARDNKRQKDLS